MAATATEEEEEMTGGAGVDAGFRPNKNLAPRYLQEFTLHETLSNFYMVGRDKNRMSWKVLKVDRLNPSELNIFEDSVTYSEAECCDLLKRIHEGNKPTGGLKFVTTCYGIVGFVKFLGPYYMLLITERREIGAICGQTIYAISKSKMITIQSSSVQYNKANSKKEKRYTKLLCIMDLTKDFFFSYSYNVMNSLQKNLYNETGQSHYESMFVWNEFLTRRIRNDLNNTMWTVALVYGFFKQVKYSFSGKAFILTLIARRSRHYAGTRYLKRGVNEKGRVANDVETEQIMFEDVPEGHTIQISSVVQNRGSIPLFWSQETSRLNIKPDIILSKKDTNYKATRLHFENLVKRYGNPIFILNLIKTREKKPRETILRTEFVNGIKYLNNNFFTDENSLGFIHWDLNSHSKKASNALALLIRVAAKAVNLTGIFYCHVPPTISSGSLTTWSIFGNNEGGDMSIRGPLFQNGVLRTNCIDCIDRTNVAQYAYGLASLGQQLHALGFMESPYIDLSQPLAKKLMELYEDMGDKLALQYGGSTAHNKIFCEQRGQWKAATRSQEFFRTLQRYYSNAYMDADKQDAINLFLGHFQPHEDKPALWELDSDQHFNIGRSVFKRSQSDGNILSYSDTSMETSRHNQLISEDATKISESTSEISTCHIPHYSSMSTRRLFTSSVFQNDNIHEDGHACDCDCSNFFDLDTLSSSGNSLDSSIPALSSENLASDFTSSAYDTGSSSKGSERTTGSQVTCYDKIAKFSENFADWVSHGGMLFH